MFLLIVNYTKPVEKVTPHAETHAQWVKKYFAEGTFLMAGPKKSKLGGAILARSIELDALKKIIAEDSFVVNNVAEYQIIDFDCKATTAELEMLKSA